MTTELLSVRLNSVNEILSLQEEKMVHEVCVHTLHFLKCFFFSFFPVCFEPEFTTNDDAAANQCGVNTGLGPVILENV